METNTNRIANRQAAVNTLAVVGFIALVIIGMALAVYAARYVPKAVSRIGSAAVSLSQVFSPAATSSLQVVEPVTVSFDGGAATTTVPATATSSEATTTPTKPVTTKPATGYTTVPVTVTLPAGTYNGPLTGLPNLVTTVTGIGYLDNNTNNFVQTLIIPSNQQLAVKFTVVNAGSNVSGTWHLSALLPTTTNAGYTYTSDQIRSLNPGESIQFTLHLGSNQARVGNAQTITISADSNHEVNESNENNDASITYSVQ